jgi:hypothetical protein
MPQILKKIYVEGPGGESILREYYVNERPPNPYKPKEGTRVERWRKKVTKYGGGRTAPDVLGYTWTMGYNNCVGRYSPGGKYARFSGSSLNRNKQLSMNIDAKKLPTAADNLLKLAFKIARDCTKNGEPVPGPVSDFICRRDPESQGRFEQWVSDQNAVSVVGIGLPIHMLSARSRGKIKDKATAFFRAAAGDRVFVTLTFIAAVDDKTGTVILNKFLTALRKEFPKLQYLWVAERQENGNIHFHMIVNKRLPVGRWNAMWVLQQYNEGLIGHNEYGEDVTKAEIDQLYDLDVREKFAGARGRNGKKISRIQKLLNPFDVRKVRSIGGLSHYLTKYITKQKKNDPFGCAVWHCSRRVSRMFTRTTVGPSAFAYMKSPANFKVDKTTGECWAPLEKREPFYVIIYANDKSAPLKYLKEMEQINKWILEGFEMDKASWQGTEIDDDDYRKRFCKN